MDKISNMLLHDLNYNPHGIKKLRDLIDRVNDVIADKNVVTKIMNNSTGLQRIELNGFAKRYLENWLLPLFIWLMFRSVLRRSLVTVV